MSKMIKNFWEDILKFNNGKKLIMLSLFAMFLIFVFRGVLNISSDNFIDAPELFFASLAVIIAEITLVSIDSLNKITSMDGSVLDNENYTCAYTEIIKEFKDIKDKEEFEKFLICVLDEKKIKKTSTCIQLADLIQNIIDHSIFFAYIDYNKNYAKINKALKLLDKQRKKYEGISNGIQYVLNENIKLINYVFEYQKNKSMNIINASYLEDVRGKMLKNPISQIVYYDYLGLDYRREAFKVLNKFECKTETCSEYMKKVIEYKNNYTSDEIEYVMELLDKSKKAFKMADELSKEDILWNGYIKYNISRVKLMKFLITGKGYNKVLKSLEEAIGSRKKVCCFYKGKENSFWDSKLDSEFAAANNLYQEFIKLK